MKRLKHDDRVNILLVDDRPENLLALEGVLEELDQNLVKANSGEEALRSLLRDDFAVVLLDVQMPDLNGFETATLMKGVKRSRHTPIIFMTAINKEEKYVFEGYAVGAVDYLFKPFDPVILRSKVSVFVDLARKEAELLGKTSALEQANQELRRIDRSKDDFLSVISHELRTPLNCFMGFAGILDDELAGPLTPEQHAYLKQMLEEGDELLMLINNLLEMSRIQAGKFLVFPRPMDFAEVVREVITLIAPRAAKRHHRLEVEVPEDLPIFFADDQRVAQLLLNLLFNAIKFTPEGGRISVRARIDGRFLRCEIEDTGKGIPEHDVPKLFHPFVQLDGSSTRETGGTGLGLSISKRIVEAQEGTIGVLSQEGKGCTIFFTLPIDSTARRADSPERAVASPAPRVANST